MIAFLILFLPGFTVQDAGAAGSRDRAAAASVECAASSAPAAEAEVDGGGQTALRLALSLLCVGVERRDDYPAGDRHPVASDGLSTVLALEVALLRRSGGDTRRNPAPDSGDEPGQPAMGPPTHPRRTAPPRHRSRSVDGRQVHGQERARAVADLEDLR